MHSRLARYGGDDPRVARLKSTDIVGSIEKAEKTIPAINDNSPHHIEPCGYQIYPVISLPALLMRH
jgi:hypothetical protein